MSGLKAAPTEILTFERPICGDTAVDTEPSVAILVSATPVNAINLACYEWSSLMYHIVYGIVYSVGKPTFASCVSQHYLVCGITNHASHRCFAWSAFHES
ncbi:hypothetical protein Y032_0054g2485 [Ancylostoma ceylanicum]|uniref:Uncharacterized protein n=1 Tax=Ancylostoma ceylanicum TaxID=53326 RepID=A0A016U680_9BILA|nr:hypothetical protein Y032_0054g2485 [Ancylostoma ceylanicum]